MKIHPCPYCGKEAQEQKDTITIRKGLVKTVLKAHNYHCPHCKRDFNTNEQRLETSGQYAKHSVKLTKLKGNATVKEPKTNE